MGRTLLGQIRAPPSHPPQLLWTTVKFPALMTRFLSTGGQRPNVFGTVVRIVVVQQMSRCVPGIGRATPAVVR
jgi:hypothetical protein